MPRLLRCRSILFALLALALPAAAQTPAFVTHQGILEAGDGTPLSGNFVLTFRLYDVDTGGDPLWEEDQGLEVENGVFTASLGAVTPFDTLGFRRPYWLGVSVNAGEELAPRMPLSAVPYSLTARTLGDEALEAGANVSITRNADHALVITAATEPSSAFSFTEQNNGNFLAFLNRTNRIGAEWFGVRAPVTSENQWGGMYMETNGTGITNTKPFYGYAHNNAVQGWHELDGATNEWRLIIGANTRFKVDGDTGDAFADGAFTGGGADLAEVFAVEGPVSTYAPGDVLVISTTSDRRVEKSTSAYSTLVAGVHATQPGVVLSEYGVAGAPDDHVPMGVVGVVPTKVSAEGGPIRRGDLLVTSNTLGHAMKADPEKLGFGMTLGKALENYDGDGTGVIKVLINVK